MSANLIKLTDLDLYLEVKIIFWEYFWLHFEKRIDLKISAKFA